MKRVHSEESKQKMSMSRKKFLKENPDKHCWTYHNKFKSNPCEKVKQLLNQHGILFIEEYSPELENRFFSIDIAFPDKKIALEINGNQHYNRDGTLSPYYQKRNDLLEKHSWLVYNIHYSACYNEDLIFPIIQKILDSPIKLEFDYISYIPKPKNQIFCKSCNKEITIYGTSGLCFTCRKFNDRKSVRPNKEDIQLLLLEKPITKISKDYGVSDNAIIRWCKDYDIPRPGRGYWEKVYHNK